MHKLHKHSTGVFTAGLLLLAITAGADAAERERRLSQHNQTGSMQQRLHNRDGRHADRVSRHGHERGHDHRDRHEHNRHERDRHLHRGHELWRNGTDGRHHRGYWHTYHHQRHHQHAYRHRYHNNYHYYYNAAGFYFPDFGFIAHGHRHAAHCPHWHFEDFAAGLVLGAIILD
jgi:hypothetical protein